MLSGLDRLAAQDLAGFAQANGWRYAETGEPPAGRGSLWEQVSRGVVHDRVSGEGWEAGRITGGHRSAESVEQRGGWTVTKSVSVDTPERSIDLGYLAIALPRRVPHLVLDARTNDRGPFSSLLERPRSDQALSLEGDFDRHFRLYAPHGYERDALYVFTPDLMALLIDETGDLDVELRDDRLIVYRPGGFDLHDPATWERFERIRTVVGAKAWSRTLLYSDQHEGDQHEGDWRGEPPGLVRDGPAGGAIGAGGRRLRNRMPRWAWIGIGVAVAAIAFASAIVVVVLTAVG